MTEAGRGPSLTAKAGAILGIRFVTADALECDVALPALVPGKKNFTHTSFAEQTLDPVGTDSLQHTATAIKPSSLSVEPQLRHPAPQPLRRDPESTRSSVAVTRTGAQSFFDFDLFKFHGLAYPWASVD